MAGGGAGMWWHSALPVPFTSVAGRGKGSAGGPTPRPEVPHQVHTQQSEGAVGEGVSE